jgi:hypothetical protein
LAGSPPLLLWTGLLAAQERDQAVELLALTVAVRLLALQDQVAEAAALEAQAVLLAALVAFRVGERVAVLPQ